MNFRLTLMAAALAAAMTSNVYAATSVDGVTAAIHSGTGVGDLVLALKVGTQSITLDLSDTINAAFNDLTVNDIKALATGGQGFTIDGNTALNDFLTTNGTTGLVWNLFGVSNVGTADGGIFAPPTSTDFGVATTVAGTPAFPGFTGADLQVSIVNNASWVNSNVAAGLPDNGTVTANAGQNHFFTSPLGAHDTMIAGQNATGVGLGTLDFYYIQRDPSRTTVPSLDDLLDADPSNDIGSDGLPPIASLLGSFTLSFNGAAASLTFAPPTAVPVPTAVWLFGSALAGMAGVRRRRAA